MGKRLEHAELLIKAFPQNIFVLNVLDNRLQLAQF